MVWGGAIMGRSEIVIRLPRCILVLKHDEIMAMLKVNPSIWAQALRRGKGYSRTEKAMSRKD
ncbi:hypothetical protein [Sporomusa acidovorans]|uniref:hypothetical protein n=2 Tax=Sporomusa acidovorans TaxID=112900 RepID=UPI0035A0E0A1